MEQVLVDSGIDALVARDTWSAEEYKELLKLLTTVSNPPAKLRRVLADLEAVNPDPRGATALKIGILRGMLGRNVQAMEAYSNATDNKDRRYFQGLCYEQLRDYGKAAEEFERAADRGWDKLEIDLKLVEMKALSGSVEEAQKALAKLEGKAGQAADYQYLRGLIADLSGRHEAAAEAYLQARTICPNHAAATFRLAYYCDLYGEEEQAVALYRECVSRPPVNINALLNLSVLYEDIGKNELAAACLKRILAVHPNHARARLFLKDTEASRTMYFDEDQARRIARRNAVMDIPVTDFELSVRARNCLKKMNIRSLGDLVRTNEATLLGYKNFGETSLKEIKDMLAIKGLHLGQALEEGEEFAESPLLAPAAENEGVRATPLEQVEFSVRVRRALEGLKVKTLGDLASRTEAELLACKNFGQTSLNEVQQRLTEHGLRLRE